MLAARVWFVTYLEWFAQLFAKLSMGRSSRAARDWALRKQASRIKTPEFIWTEDEPAAVAVPLKSSMQAAE